MRNPLIILLSLFSVLATLGTPARLQADEAGRIFMFVRDGSRDLDLMLTEEVNVMRRMLEDAGYRVDVATSNGQPMAGDSLILEPDVALDDVDLSAYDGIVLPCMAPGADAEVLH